MWGLPLERANPDAKVGRFQASGHAVRFANGDAMRNLVDTEQIVMRTEPTQSQPLDPWVKPLTPRGAPQVERIRAYLVARERTLQARHSYEAFHERRYQYLLNLLNEIAPGPDPRVLDVGRSPLSYRLAARYREVWTLGFPLDQSSWDYPSIDGGAQTSMPMGHIVFDLNVFQNGKCIDCQYGTFDVIVLAETIEHLTAAPELVLAGLGAALKPGGFLICQTPNAAALHKRLKLLFGFNPYERIRVDQTNPGHFREYTRRELVEIGAEVGLDVVRHEYKEYFGCEGNPVKRLAGRVLPLVSRVVPSFARGQTIVYRRPTA